MISISVRTNITGAVAALRGAAAQIPFATSVALNKTAQRLQGAISDEAKARLSAKPFTTGRNALYLRPSNKRRLVAEVGYKDIQARYMQWQIAGGRRRNKAFEGALRGMGALPDGWVTVPGAGIKLDAYGNIPRRVLSEILGQLRTRRGTFAGRGKRLALRALFVALPGSRDKRVAHLAPGIWQRIDDLNGRTAVRPLMLYVSGADYRKRIDLAQIARRTVDQHFDAEFRAALDRALASAR